MIVPSFPGLPNSLNLGSGKDFRDDCFNLDVDDTWAPDAICDLSAVKQSLAHGLPLTTTRFGNVTLRTGCFDQIIANDVLEHVPDLMTMMTRCLELLRVDGVFRISVPYDLSFGAWQDPTHVRAFNERSWLYYTDWFWYMGWSETRFVLDSFDFVPSPLGETLKAQNISRDEILRTPRAIDSMRVVLRKVVLSAEDQTVWAFWRERKRQAHERAGQAKTATAPGGAGIAAMPVKSAPVSSMPAAAASVAPAPVEGVSVEAVSAETISVGTTTPKAFDGPLAEHLDRYAIWIVTPGDYAHQHAYDELATGLSEAFVALGGSAPIVRDPTLVRDRTLIILGPQLLPANAIDLLQKPTVLFNLEQAQASSPWFTKTYVELLKHHPVLDYSVRNAAALGALGITQARVLPIGYAPGLARIRQAQEKDIDVLFYGSLNERRRHILDSLTARNVKVQHMFGVYGAERDAAIARAKIVLNMHFYDAAIFEAVRVSYLLANGVCVVSEGEPGDLDIAPYSGGMVVAPYGDLVMRCMSLLQDQAAREEIAAAGHAAIQRRSQADLLRALFSA